MAQLGERERRFLDENPFVGIATTLREDGSPHSTVDWVDADGGVSFNTARGRTKERNLTRDPRVSLTVMDPSDPFKWVSVSGRADVTEEGAVEQIDRLAKKYTGRDEYGVPEGETRVRVAITPERVTAVGFD